MLKGDLSRIKMVLVETTHPGNIGSAARAMKTMGIQSLVLVNPKVFPDSQAYAMAAGADEILDKAEVVDSLEKALVGSQLILGTSARQRDQSLPLLTPHEQATVVCSHRDSNVAILFGREHAGLTNSELMLCHYHIHIPSNPDYSSLNLAQAVQIIAYELHIKHLAPEPSVSKLPLAHAEDVEKFHQHLSDILSDIGFLKQNMESSLLLKLRRLFNKSLLEPQEINILRGILTQIKKKLSQGREQDEL